MNHKRILFISFILLTWIVVFGFIAPALISSATFSGPILGLLLLFFLCYFTYWSWLRLNAAPPAKAPTYTMYHYVDALGTLHSSYEAPGDDRPYTTSQTTVAPPTTNHSKDKQ